MFIKNRFNILHRITSAQIDVMVWMSIYLFSGWHYRYNGNFCNLGWGILVEGLQAIEVYIEEYYGTSAGGPSLFIFSYCLPGHELSSLLYHALIALTIWRHPAEAQSHEPL